MPKVAIRTADKADAVAPPAGAGDDVETHCYFDGDAHSIHLRHHRLAGGARLRLAARETDLAVFVWKGAVTAEGTSLKRQSSAVIQNGAELTVVADADGAEVLVFNMRDGGGTTEGGRAYLLPNERVPRTFAMGGTEGVGGALHADAGEPTSDVWLHENSYAMADKETALHSHSEDEVIFVTDGSVRLGNRLYGPGTALAIAADTLYEFWSGPDGLSFVNFRGSSPTYTTADGKTVLDEAELWRKAVGRPSYLEVAAA